MRVLIFGAGCVGQLYGLCLQHGGADVDVYIRPKYVEQAKEGYRLYDRKRGFRDHEIFAPDAIQTTTDGVAEQDYDAVILSVSATALYGDWLPELAEAIGDTPVICLSPGIATRDRVSEFVDNKRVAFGMITSVSYPAPLPGEDVSEPGTAYWFPPMAPALFEGPSEFLEPVTQVLEAGGMKSKIVGDVSWQASSGSAVLMPTVAVLEMLGWSFKDLRKSKEHRQLLNQATEESLTLMEAHYSERRPLPMRLLGPTTWKGALMMAPMVAPFDLETYLQVHFTKVGDQTRMFLENYIERRQEMGLESPALATLREAIGDEPKVRP